MRKFSFFSILLLQNAGIPFLLAATFLLGCARYPIGDYILEQPKAAAAKKTLPAQYGSGEDGDITITSTNVNITDLFENDNVVGVITKRGVNKGLNKGIGSYDPKNGSYIQAANFTIASGASITAYQRSANDKQGIFWIACFEVFSNMGTVDLVGRGFSGGSPAPTPCSSGSSGSGAGAGGGGNCTAGGASGYAGGGGGGQGFGGAGTPGTGGHGGGAVRIFADTIRNNGTISADGATGTIGCIASGGGGGGSGGTVYLESVNEITLGNSLISAAAGSGNTGGNCGGLQSGNGGNGSVGRVHVVGTYSGVTSPAPQ